MFGVFAEIGLHMEFFKKDLTSKLGATIEISSCAPNEPESHYYARQIIDYAKQFNYYANLSLNKCWGRMFIEIDEIEKYRLVLSLHHYGYDNGTFAIGAFLSKVISRTEDRRVNVESRREYIDVPLGIPPLTMSSEKEVPELVSSIKQHVEISIMTLLAYIANELG